MRVWRDISVVSLAVVVVTVPFLILNLQLRAAEGFSRSITEIESFSANVYGDLTAPSSPW